MRVLEQARRSQGAPRGLRRVVGGLRRRARAAQARDHGAGADLALRRVEAGRRALLQVYARAYGLETVCLRYFNVFGPRQDPKSEYAAVIPKFITAALAGQAPRIFGDGTQSRDFCHIDNVIEANFKAASAPAAGLGRRVQHRLRRGHRPESGRRGHRRHPGRRSSRATSRAGRRHQALVGRHRGGAAAPRVHRAACRSPTGCAHPGLVQGPALV